MSFGEATAISVEVFNPETPFGGVQVIGATDMPIQIVLHEGVQGETGPAGPAGPTGDQGVAGGVADQGVMPLIEDQGFVTVVFPVAQPNSDWTFIQLTVVNTADPNPLNIWPGIVTAKTTTGFTLQLNGLPDSPNYYLHWCISGESVPDVPATSYTLSGPSSGVAAVASTNFTVSLPVGTVADTPVTVTPSDGGGGGTFTPATVSLSTGTPSATFTYTPVSSGAKTVSATNDGGLSDPGNLTYTVTGLVYTLSGPSTGDVGAASTNFTVTLPSGVAGTVIVTPSSGGGGGTFAPTSLSLVASGSGTFTYTPASAGAKTISTTNDGGLTNPTSLTYTATSNLHLLNTLISYWKLDEGFGANRNDSQGTNHLTDGGGNTNVGTGKISGCALFAGTQNLLINSNSTLQVTGDFAFSVWVKNTGAMAFSCVFAKAQSAASSFEYLLLYDDTNGFRWVVGDTAGATSTIAGVGSAATVSTWYHLVCWYDSSDKKARMRINDATTYVAPTGIPTAPLAAAAKFITGARDAGPIDGFYVGSIDEVGFWKRTLSSLEITALYNAGAALPFSSFTS